MKKKEILLLHDFKMESEICDKAETQSLTL